MKKTVFSVFATVAVVASGFSASVSAAEVAVQPAPEKKVTICHRTDSVKNPYVRITVDQSAVDGIAGNSGGQADHYGEHKGPIATSEAVAQGYKDTKTEWGDIIPPVEGAHNGLNYTAEGQAILNNGCNYVTPVNSGPGGMGGGGSTVQTKSTTPTTPATPTTPKAPATNPASPQVQAPVASPNAGGGGAAGPVLPVLAALLVSIVSMGYGLIRFTKFGA